jgi:predicted dehydrogenase
MSQKRYALVGTGGRCEMFVEAICKDFKEHAVLVGLCDISPTRMNYYDRKIQEKHGLPPTPCYEAADFDKMIQEQKPDTVIVTSMDSTHHQYIVRAMELGCDAITEKPMTIDAGKAHQIFDAIERTGRKLRVTFNYRYSPTATLVRKLLMEGTIGTPLAVDFSWVLNTSHGADYFRRWHAEKDKSGGLLVHKATHHFDLINWWIDSRPETVFAMGDLKFYGRKNAEARGESYSYDRYTGAEEAENDPFALVLDDTEKMGASVKKLYLDAEADSGYIRDKNVFGDHITIEDTMTVLAKYRSGVLLNYSLIAYTPWEGYCAAVTGNKGRIEVVERHGSHIITGQSDEELAAAQSEGAAHEVRVYPMFGVSYDVEIPKAEGGHGGGDPILLEDIFSPNPPADPYYRAASHLEGAASILVGISANESIRTGRPIVCDELLPIPDAAPDSAA